MPSGVQPVPTEGLYTAKDDILSFLLRAVGGGVDVCGGAERGWLRDGVDEGWRWRKRRRRGLSNLALLCASTSELRFWPAGS